MALRCTSPYFTISRKTPESITKAVMLPTRCHAQPMKRIKTFKNFSSTDNKIYEDKVIGIIGYRDKNGEAIYEGFDEGPRLPHEELELIKNEREMRTRAQLQKLLFDTIQADPPCGKDAVFTSTKSEDEIINK